MKLPCEKAIWYILPRIRADVARELVKEGMSQTEVAEKLGLTPAAVSQYLHKKRGTKKKMSPEYDKLLKETIEKIKNHKGEEELCESICACCKCANK